MRLFAIRRLKNHISKKALFKVVDGIFTSKIRYGIQLFGKMRRCEEDPLNEDFEHIQKIQNKMMRIITGTKLQDRVSTKTLLSLTNCISVNQINAQIKIQEVWKALNIENYPLKIEKHNVNDIMAATRACTSGKLIEMGKSIITQKTYKNDAIKLWNSLHKHVQTCTTHSEILKSKHRQKFM